MTLAAAIPLRGGMINLGGDGQMVVGALVGAIAPLLLPVPGPLAAALALARGGAGRRALRGARRLGRDRASAFRC